MTIFCLILTIFAFFGPKKPVFAGDGQKVRQKRTTSPKGIQTFEDIRRDDYVYVDNSSDVPGLRFGNVIDTAHARKRPWSRLTGRATTNPSFPAGRGIIGIEGWKIERS